MYIIEHRRPLPKTARLGPNMSGFQTHEQMHMVIGATDCFRDSIDVFHDAPEIGMQSIAPCRTDDALAIFCAEDQMVMKGAMGRWHKAGKSAWVV